MLYLIRMGIIESINTIFILSSIAVVFSFALYFKLKKKVKQDADIKCEQELAGRDFVISKCIEVPCYSGGFYDIRHYTKFLVDDEHKKFAVFHYKKDKSFNFA